MRKISVTQEQFLEIIQCYYSDGVNPKVGDQPTSKYEDAFHAAANFGFQGFHGGFDRAEITRNGRGFALYDKGLYIKSTKTTTDGSVEFYVSEE